MAGEINRDLLLNVLKRDILEVRYEETSDNCHMGTIATYQNNLFRQTYSLWGVICVSKVRIKSNIKISTTDMYLFIHNGNTNMPL